MASSGANASMDPNYVPPEQGIKFAVIIVATLANFDLHPFLQNILPKEC